MRTKDMHRLVLKELCLDRRMLKRIIRIGLPAGMQSVMYGLSNVIIQSGINSLGTNTVAAWAAYSKLDSVFWMMINAFGISVTTFVGQNYGAGKMDRVHRGVRTCMVMTVLASLGMSFLIYHYGVYGYELFTTDQDVIAIGIAMMRYLAPLYVEYVAIEILSGALRGVGDCWVSVKQFSKNDTATACQDWLRSTRLGRGSIKSHVRTVKVLGMGLFAFQERVHLWKGVTH